MWCWPLSQRIQYNSLVIWPRYGIEGYWCLGDVVIEDNRLIISKVGGGRNPRRNGDGVVGVSKPFLVDLENKLVGVIGIDKGFNF